MLFTMLYWMSYFIDLFCIIYSNKQKCLIISKIFVLRAAVSVPVLLQSALRRVWLTLLCCRLLAGSAASRSGWTAGSAGSAAPCLPAVFLLAVFYLNHISFSRIEGLLVTLHHRVEYEWVWMAWDLLWFQPRSLKLCEFVLLLNTRAHYVLFAAFLFLTCSAAVCTGCLTLSEWEFWKCWAPLDDSYPFREFYLALFWQTDICRFINNILDCSIVCLATERATDSGTQCGWHDCLQQKQSSLRRCFRPELHFRSLTGR